ncbi:MAG TPA: molybdopterin-dependent oxidoreductase, partial [Acetobacteraceae bacterium]|nr:molybdopterin-dependent oxidoreductase [Acetobacteraceae bacterium]
MTGPLQANAISRRQVLGQGGAALAALALLDATFSRALAATDAQVIFWSDQPPPVPPAAASVIRNLQPWEALTTWITPNDKFFGIAHYELPNIDVQNWSLEIGGLVEHPRRLTLADLKSRPRQDVTFTIECGGDRGLPFFISGIGNAKWAGTPLAAVLAEARPMKNAIEVAFIGSDAGEETVRDLKFNASFARSMSLTDAMGPDNLLCYEMNGDALPPLHGA